MSDDFIPLNQSTPVRGRWQNRNQNQRFPNSPYQQNRSRRGGHNHNRWSSNSQRNSSFGTDSNCSYGQENQSSIDAYLHPSMLEDPWAKLRQRSN
ncbi:hypothetical protein evm_002879 [Chilo suppressalis]|nr:hypothetical protein evm_002879 [Chilo suppressalis]